MGGCRSSLACCKENHHVSEFHAPVIDIATAIAEESAGNLTDDIKEALDAEILVEPPLHLPIWPKIGPNLAAFPKISPNLDGKGKQLGELVEGIIWAPGGVYHSDCRFQYNVIKALDLCCAPNYRVIHYHKEAQGRAFGPLSLEQVLSFCNRLEEKTQQGQRVVLTTPPNDEPSRTNAAVLLGTFLIHVRGWAVQEVAEAMSADADRKFVCSWARRDRPEPVPRMPVRDCWAAMDEARNRGWFPQKGFGELSPELLEICNMRARFDAAWIVPGKILLCADPVSTALDPNPATFDSIFPSEDTFPNPVLSACDDWDELESVSSCDSTHTVNKDYSSEEDVSSNGTMDDKHGNMSFVEFLHRCGVRLLVRANYPNEPGLSGSYDSKRFATFGMKHLDVPFEDRNGGLPSAPQIAEVLQACRAIIKEGSDDAVAIHCKGGFGRSAVLAACVASSCFQIPGPALLAWVRIARPGTVTTPEQEYFIQNLGKDRFDGDAKKSYTSFAKAARSLKEGFGRRVPIDILAEMKGRPSK
jgi:hypothetical protein